MTLHNVKGCVVALTTVAAAALAFASCTKEAPSQDPAPGSDYNLEECVFQAVGDTAATKTQLFGTSVKWQDGDQLAVFAKVPTAVKTAQRFTRTDTGTSASASFKGDIQSGTTKFVALYPYSDGLSFNVTETDSLITGASIPTEQTATGNSFASGASLAIAEGKRDPGKDSDSLKFSNLCAVIGFTLPSDITFASQVVVTANNGAKIAGNVSINASTPAITSADATSVTVNGTFTGGNTYYVCIAPGTYTDGFKFVISTKEGNSYTRSTSKTLPAEAGKIYALGKLSLVMTANDFTPSVKLQNTLSGSTLTGTTATLTITPRSEFASAISAYSYTVTLKNGSTIYRSLTDATADPSKGVTITAESGLPYMPKGSYNCEISLYYTTGGVKKGPISLSTSVSQGAPSGFTVNANLTGYTSYSVYKGTDGQTASASNANDCDNATIYNIGATYASGVSSAVLTQCSNLWSFSSSKLDGSTKEGDATKQSWSTHTISADWSFDGASGTVSKTVYVVGLPYSVDTDGTNFGWSPTTGDFGESYGYTCWSYNTKKNNTKESSALSPVFPVPGDVSVNVKMKCYAYHGSSGSCTAYVWMGASNEFQKVGNSTQISSDWNLPYAAEYDTPTHSTTLTSSTNRICVYTQFTMKKGTYISTKPGVYSDYININYN